MKLQIQLDLRKYYILWLLGEAPISQYVLPVIWYYFNLIESFTKQGCLCETENFAKEIAASDDETSKKVAVINFFLSVPGKIKKSKTCYYLLC